MTPEFALEYVIKPALSLLPEKMDSKEARAMLLAIAMQESKLIFRTQIRGPARGYWQFEEGGGTKGVVTHRVTKQYAAGILALLDYENTVAAAHEALKNNDLLAAVFARLLLWTVPYNLPGENQEAEAWAQYIAGWRPGKPRPDKWAENWKAAWEAVNNDRTTSI